MRTLELSLILSLGAALLVAGCAPRTASDEEVRVQRRGADFSQWDEDDDGQLTRAEFRVWIDDEGVLRRYDRDGDGELSQAEFSEFLFDFMDRDGNEQIDPSEWSGFVPR